MFRYALTGLIAAGLAFAPVAGAADADKAGKHYKKAGKKVATGTKEMAHDVEDGEITAGAKDFGKGVGSGAKHAGKGTVEGAKVVGDKAEDVGEATYKGAKKGVKKTGSALKDAFDGKNEGK